MISGWVCEKTKRKQRRTALNKSRERERRGAYRPQANDPPLIPPTFSAYLSDRSEEEWNDTIPSVVFQKKKQPLSRFFRKRKVVALQWNTVATPYRKNNTVPQNNTVPHKQHRAAQTTPYRTKLRARSPEPVETQTKPKLRTQHRYSLQEKATEQKKDTCIDMMQRKEKKKR